uniref:Solute carrier family 25 member 28 n=23 Tax=Neognathae TaxID=8825 RepID=A0A8B9SN84_ANAPL
MFCTKSSRMAACCLPGHRKGSGAGGAPESCSPRKQQGEEQFLCSAPLHPPEETNERSSSCSLRAPNQSVSSRGGCKAPVLPKLPSPRAPTLLEPSLLVPGAHPSSSLWPWPFPTALTSAAAAACRRCTARTAASPCASGPARGRQRSAAGAAGRASLAPAPPPPPPRSLRGHGESREPRAPGASPVPPGGAARTRFDLLDHGPAATVPHLADVQQVVRVAVVRRPDVDEDPGAAAAAVHHHAVAQRRVLRVGGRQLLQPRQGAAVSTHMLAGAVAGVMEHCVMYPVDCVKTRMQSLRPEPAARYRNVLEALWRIVRTEGVWRPMRGMNITATGAGPAHALYFACYEKLKKTLSDVIHAGGNSHVANGAAGCVATLLHDAAMNPAEVVKQRMQMYNSPYQRVTDCVRAVWRNEGAGAFYRSYTTQLTMNIPFQAIHFMTYEFLQEQLNPHRQYNPGSHVVSGACAGAVAAAATTPLDVCKTLLNTQESLALSSNISGHITGMANAFRTVYQVGGVTAYFRGVQARVIYQMPSTAIAWSVYEFFKYILTKRQEERRAGK